VADRRPDQGMELHREMAEQVDKHRWVVEAHMDTEGNPTGYCLESDAGDCQYL
jgi:predicted TIM-barrel fold metal-dependent hydrolase